MQIQNGMHNEKRFSDNENLKQFLTNSLFMDNDIKLFFKNTR